MKSVCQTLNGPLINLKCSGAVQVGFHGLYFGQVRQVFSCMLSCSVVSSSLDPMDGSPPGSSVH